MLVEVTPHNLSRYCSQACHCGVLGRVQGDKNRWIGPHLFSSASASASYKSPDPASP